MDQSPELDANDAHAGAAGAAAIGAKGGAINGVTGGAIGVAGGANGVAGGASGVGGGASGSSDSGAQEPGILLVDGYARGVGVVADHDGNALVHWDDGAGRVHFARWNAAAQAWLYPAPIVLNTAIVIDTYGSGHPLLIGDEIDPQSAVRTTVVRRFDVQANEWGPEQPTGIGGAFAYAFYLSMDGAGNAYVYWRDSDQSTEDWTWWPVDSAAWAPLRTIDRASGIVGARQAGAWLWQENSGFGVRAFDLGAGDWRDEYELQPLGSASALAIHTLAVGPSGEALAAALHHDPTELVMDVWRYDPALAAWQPKETALQVATNADPNTTYGPYLPITDFFHHDIVAFSRPVGGEFELQMNRREPSTGIWSPLHEFVGLTTPNEIEFTGDESGNLYGVSPPGALFQYSAATGVWTDTPIDIGSIEFATSRTGAFALGWKSSGELAAYRHPGGAGEWRSAQGMPAGAFPEIGSASFAIAPLGEDRAIVAWLIRETGGSASIRAAFIE